LIKVEHPNDFFTALNKVKLNRINCFQAQNLNGLKKGRRTKISSNKAVEIKKSQDKIIKL
jgi:hypothetical protein